MIVDVLIYLGGIGSGVAGTIVYLFVFGKDSDDVEN